METDQLRLKNYRGLKKSQYTTIGFYQPPIEPLLNDIPILIQLIFTEREQFSGPHCTTISWIYLFGDGKTAFVRAFIRALI